MLFNLLNFYPVTLLVFSLLHYWLLVTALLCLVTPRYSGLLPLFLSPAYTVVRGSHLSDQRATL